MRKSMLSVKGSLRRIKHMKSVGGMRSWWHGHDTGDSIHEKQAVCAASWIEESGVDARPRGAFVEGKGRERARIPAMWLGLGA